MFALKKDRERLIWPILFACLTVFVTPYRIDADFRTAENYCARCHEPHVGVDYEIYNCLSCHAAVPMGYAELYPWYSSEAAIAGIQCMDCHSIKCLGDSCLSCHSRHSNPLR